VTPARTLLAVILLFVGMALLAGCGHKQTQVMVPAPPPISEQKPEAPQETSNPHEEPAEKIDVPADAKPIYEQTGMASWYGAPYHNRRGSNGEVYNMNAMTAAHLTLPLGSIVRVTNVKTGHSVVLRITDRGPFVEGRRQGSGCLSARGRAGSSCGVESPISARFGWKMGRADRPLSRRGRRCGVNWPPAASLSDREGPQVREPHRGLVGTSSRARR